jgi:hypothetical protein
VLIELIVPAYLFAFATLTAPNRVVEPDHSAPWAYTVADKSPQ